MKKTTYLKTILVATVISSISFFYACDKEEASSLTDTSTGTYCTTSQSACGGSFQACANSTGAWYTYNGKKYTCASTGNCTAAATALANDMCKTGRLTKKELDEKVKKILNTFPTDK